MTPHRVAGAPRLIEWTGERLVPWAPDPPVVYEHYHRYLFAAQLVAGRDVLDLASGEGYGTALLADSARSVVGIDVDERSVEHSRLNYKGPNLEFRIADARNLTEFESGRFDAVVAFEVIEHVDEQEEVLAELERVLAQDGILILSTPERTVYSKGGKSDNPFHVHELSADELLGLLRPRFAQLATWAQRTVTGSALIASGEHSGDRPRPFILERADDQWELASDMSAMYVIAVASKAELPAMPEDSVLVDPGQELLARSLDAKAQAEESERTARDELRQHIDELDQVRRRLLALGDELQNERVYVAALQQRAAGDEQVIAKLHDQLAHATQWRRGVEESVTWRVLQRVRAGLYGVIGGRQSLVGRLLQGLLQAVGRVLH